jgi:Tfp pilus assembly protein PilF
MNRGGWAGILVLPLILQGLAGCGASSARLQEQAANRISIGSAYLGSGQYTAALKELLEAEKLTPDDPKVYYLLGIAYHGKGLADLAIDQFRKSIALKANNPEVHNHLGAIYLEQGRWDDAIASFRAALSSILYETPAISLYNLGRAYQEKRDYDRALKHYQDAMEKDPDSILVPLIEKSLGTAWLAKGRTEEALSHFKRSVELVPSLVESHYWLGICYQKLERTAEAAASFQTAARLTPDSEFGRMAKESLQKLSP